MENKKLQGSDGFYVFFHPQNRMEKTFSIGMSLMCERFFSHFIVTDVCSFRLRAVQWGFSCDECNENTRNVIGFWENQFF